MDWRRAALAAAGGVVAFALIFSVFLYFFLLALDDISTALMGGRTQTSGEIAALYALILAAITAGGALPLLALGVPWWRAVFTPPLAHLAAFAVFDALNLLQDERGTVVLFVVGAALTVAAGTAWPRGGGWHLTVAPFAATALPLVVAALPGFEMVLAVLLAWVLLPVVAVAMRSRGDRALVSDKAT